MYILMHGEDVPTRPWTGEMRPDNDNIVVGNYAKVKARYTDGNTESFWVKIVDMDGSVIHCIIDNDLVLGPDRGLNCGDKIQISRWNIGCILEGDGNVD